MSGFVNVENVLKGAFFLKSLNLEFTYEGRDFEIGLHPISASFLTKTRLFTCARRRARPACGRDWKGWRRPVPKRKRRNEGALTPEPWKARVCKANATQIIKFLKLKLGLKRISKYFFKTVSVQKGGLKKKLAFLFCVWGILILMTSCGKKSSINEEAKSEKLCVKVVRAGMETFCDEMDSFGTVIYRLKNDVTSLVNGTIGEFLVKEGDFVKKGQVIAKLKNVQLEIQREQYLLNLESAKAAVELAEAEYAQAVLGVESRVLAVEKAKLNLKRREIEYELQKKNFENQRQLYEIGGVTKNSLEQQKISLESTGAEIEILKKEIEISSLGLRRQDLEKNGMEPAEEENLFQRQIVEFNTRTAFASLMSAKAAYKNALQQLSAVNKYIEELSIKSPVAGILGEKYFETGEYLKENEKIAVVFDTESVFVAAEIQEKDRVNLLEDAPVAVEFPSLNRCFSSKIAEISPAADFQSGNFSIKIPVDNPEGVLKPGMFARCKIQKNLPEEYVCIPDLAFQGGEEEEGKVFCVANGFAVQKEVKVKSRKNGKIWLEKGLEEGETVILNPAMFLKDGQAVQAAPYSENFAKK